MTPHFPCFGLQNLQNLKNMQNLQNMQCRWCDCHFFRYVGLPVISWNADNSALEQVIPSHLFQYYEIQQQLRLIWSYEYIKILKYTLLAKYIITVYHENQRAPQHGKKIILSDAMKSNVKIFNINLNFLYLIIFIKNCAQDHFARCNEIWR